MYNRLLGTRQVTTSIIEGGLSDIRAGHPDDSDVAAVAHALQEAERPLIYVGDGVWKSGAESHVTTLAEHCGAAVAAGFQDLRGVPIKHRLHCGRFEPAVPALQPDLILCIGVRHSGAGLPEDYHPFATAQRVVAIGPDLENLTNLPGPDLAVLADERRTLERLLDACSMRPLLPATTHGIPGLSLRPPCYPVKIAAGFGVEGMCVQEETRLAAALDHGLKIVEEEQRPFLLDVRLPLGVPTGGQAAGPFRLAPAMSGGRSGQSKTFPAPDHS